MSKVVRKRLLDTIELLEKGTKIVGRLITDQRGEDCLTLLFDCQELAIAIGMKTEQLHGQGTKTVEALEEYCESIYQLAQALQNWEEDIAVSASAGLCTRMAYVQESFEIDFPDKMEVVFLPYKASMWDALESVWMAARDDENCEAYVIPIPYYTLDSDHAFKDFCYEGEQYPDYVPVTDYKDYDLELHHPDMIFVHNPYDEFNNVTSIAPEYYLKKIKDYTEKLVYIPYFVWEEVDPHDQLAIDERKHFCFLPGTIYADHVIVQSEDMREIYIKTFRKEAKQQGWSDDSIERARLEKKFLGIGSPKLDKVTNSSKEDLEIPDAWLRIIEKPDGKWKKIFFYNTSINALLTHDEKLFVKIRDVFQVFKQNREEIALLWRPHPLIQDTIEAMRPKLWQEYQKIVQQYKDEGWGIYDDTSDLERAVLLSDAYYGDDSSVVQLFRSRGKSVMIQNVEELYYVCKGL